MALVDDLKAAKSLIDTPEKADQMGVEAFNRIARAILNAVAGHPDRYADVREALRAQMPENETLVEFSERPHHSIMALFDRAIKHAEAA